MRHVRAHRQERPFDCRYCTKSFARKDLLSRHEKTLHAEEYKEPDNPRKADLRRASMLLSSRLPVVAPNGGIRTVHQGELRRDDTKEDAESHGDDLNVPSTSSSTSVIPQSQAAQGTLVTDLSSYDFSTSPGDQMAAAEIDEVFALTTGSHPPEHGDELVSESSLQTLAQRDQLEQGFASAYSLSKFQSDSLNEMAMPLDLENPEIFSLLDDSLFAQMSLPMDMMDFELSPQSLGANSSTPGKTFDDSMGGEDGSQHMLDVVNVFGSRTAEPSRKLRSERPSLRRREFKSSRMTIDNILRARLLDDLRSNYKLDEEQLADLPTTRMLDNFTCKYFQCFQKHLPIFHVPTFTPASIPAPLLLAICSIGALYTLNRKHAAALRLMANTALHSTQTPKFVGRQSPLEMVWQTQCRSLIIFGAMYGGSLWDTSDGISELGTFVRIYALRRASLSSQTRAEHLLSWEEWIDFELCKRLLCCIYITSSLNVATYDLPPGFYGLRDLDFELPADEALWEAETREEWQQILCNQVAEPPGTMSAVLNRLVFGNDTRPSSPADVQIGAFAITVIMHGINVHMWNLAQSKSFLMLDDPDAVLGHTIRVSHHTQTEKILVKCQDFLKAWQLAHEDSQHTRLEDSLVFNCQSLLRLAYVRIFSGMRYFNRATLLYEDTDDISSAVRAYVNAPQENNVYLTKAAEQVMFCFLSPVRAGHLLTRKTAAFTWSIEHAIACWDGNIFLSKWIHTVEMRQSLPNAEELAIFENLKEALQEAESPYDPESSLAAQVARTWAAFMDDVWVWEVTVRMGAALRQLASVYDASWRQQRAHTVSLQSETIAVP